MAAHGGCSSLVSHSPLISKQRWSGFCTSVAEAGARLWLEPCGRGAVSAPGNAARLQWLYDSGFRISSPAAVHAEVQHAGLDFLQQLEECGYLHNKYGACYHYSHAAATSTAAASSTSAAKLQWLAENEVEIGTYDVAIAAAQHANLDSLQLLTGQPFACQRAFTSGDALAASVIYGHAPAASVLASAGGASPGVQSQHVPARWPGGGLGARLRTGGGWRRQCSWWRRDGARCGTHWPR